MDKIERQLLLKDICSRLPYDLWVEYEGNNYVATGYGHGRISLLPSVFSSVGGPYPLVEEIKPYLRQMSSMTENERVFYKCQAEAQCSKLSLMLVDWLNEHHLDFRGLIAMGLALEAPEGMYKTG